MSACSRCNAGPSDAAREKAILKRQRKAGLVLAGRAAKNKRRSELVARGVTDVVRMVAVVLMVAVMVAAALLVAAVLVAACLLLS